MPIRWSPRAVTQAMDEVEKLLAQAQVHLDEVRKRTEQTQKIPNLPGYMDQRLTGLIFDIDRFAERTKSSIAWVRKAIPEQGLEQDLKQGLKAQAASRSLFDV